MRSQMNRDICTNLLLQYSRDLLEGKRNNYCAYKLEGRLSFQNNLDPLFGN